MSQVLRSAIDWSYRRGSNVFKWKCPLSSTFVLHHEPVSLSPSWWQVLSYDTGRRGILLSRQGLIKSPFEVNRKIPIDLNRLWNKSLIMRAYNNLLIASLHAMVTLDLWPLRRLDSLSSKISRSQSDPLARATPQVLFLSCFSCLKV